MTTKLRAYRLIRKDGSEIIQTRAGAQYLLDFDGDILPDTGLAPEGSEFLRWERIPGGLTYEELFPDFV